MTKTAAQLSRPNKRNRKRVNRATTEKQPRKQPQQRRLPKPRRLRSGRWHVDFRHRWQRYQATFDTPAEAEQFIARIKEA